MDSVSPQQYLKANGYFVFPRVPAEASALSLNPSAIFLGDKREAKLQALNLYTALW